MKDQSGPKTLQETIQFFSDFENCRLFMAALRWPDGIVRCPQCDSDKVAYLSKARVYWCKENHPKQKFSLKVGTVFEDSPIALEKWLPAVWMLVNDKNGISSWELHRALGVTQKSAWFMLHRIRAALKTGRFVTKLGGNGGEVEVDETFVGGKSINMHKSRRLAIQRARGEVINGRKPKPDVLTRYPGKTAVQGMLDRDLRQVRAKVVPNVKRETLQAEVLNHIAHGSRVYTDKAIAYDNLREQYIHEVVDHAQEYVQGRVHTNGLENFWSLLKRTLKGTYVAVEPFHLDRYVDEQAFRYNNRATKDNPLNDSDRFVYALSQIVGKRLTYAELTGKNASPETF
jgi:transposase-like protein